MTQSDVNTVTSSDVQSSGYQEQQAAITEAIPDTKSSDGSVPTVCLTNTSAGIGSGHISVSPSKLDASPSFSENAAGGMHIQCMAPNFHGQIFFVNL